VYCFKIVKILRANHGKRETCFRDFRKTVKHRLKIEKGLGKEISKGFMGHKTDAMDDYYTHLKMFDLWSAEEDSWKQ